MCAINHGAGIAWDAQRRCSSMWLMVMPEYLPAFKRSALLPQAGGDIEMKRAGKFCPLVRRRYILA
jgi:hypothetical protein